MSSSRWILLLLAVSSSVVLAVAGGAAAAAEAGDEPAGAERAAEPELPAGAAEDSDLEKLTPAQRREITKLLSHYRRARKDPDKQAAVLAEAVKLGPLGVSSLMQAVSQELQPQLVRYRAKFYQQAASLGKLHARNTDVDEVARLRAAVLALGKDPNLTHEKIVEVGDPAMKRLGAIFMIEPAEVLKRSRDVQTERGKLQAAGVLWERCAQILFRATPASAEKPKDLPTFERYIQGEEEMAVGLAVPMDDATREILATNNRLAQQLDAEESRTILALNLMRNVLGLKPVVIDPKLCAAARDHSHDMQTQKFFAHESPVAGKKTPWDRAGRFGTAASAENIFMGVADGRAANLAWFHSPGHHRNMLGDHKRVGMGRCGVHFTEMFGQ